MANSSHVYTVGDFIRYSPERPVFLTVRQYVEALRFPLMASGVVGNLLCFLTLQRSRILQNSHFFIYRSLSVSELIYCSSFFLGFWIKKTRISHFQGMYYAEEYISALYYMSIQRFIYSACNYLSSYLALFLSVDRCLAIWRSSSYRVLHEAQKMKYARMFVAVSFLLSCCLHSWSPFAEQTFAQTGDPNSSKVAILGADRGGNTTLAFLLAAKDVYNSVFRVIYPSLLLLLTIMILTGFHRFNKRRRTLRSSSDCASMSGRRGDRALQRDLFCLLVVVAMLALLEVIPRELRRIVDYHWVLKQPQLGLNTATHPGAGQNMLKLYLARGYLHLLSNLFTQIDKTVKFYLYILFNPSIRKCFLTTFCPCRSQSNLPSYGVSNCTTRNSITHSARVSVRGEQLVLKTVPPVSEAEQEQIFV